MGMEERRVERGWRRGEVCQFMQGVGFLFYCLIACVCVAGDKQGTEGRATERGKMERRVRPTLGQTERRAFR